jgi:hypothetical protein
MSLQTLLNDKWLEEKAPDLEGLVTANGDFYEIKTKALNKVESDQYELTHRQFVKAEKLPIIEDWLSVCVNAKFDVSKGKYRVFCGEAANHGSIGFVALQSVVTGQVVWSFASKILIRLTKLKLKVAAYW